MSVQDLMAGTVAVKGFRPRGFSPSSPRDSKPPSPGIMSSPRTVSSRVVLQRR